MTDLLVHFFQIFLIMFQSLHQGERGGRKHGMTHNRGLLKKAGVHGLRYRPHCQLHRMKKMKEHRQNCLLEKNDQPLVISNHQSSDQFSPTAIACVLLVKLWLLSQIDSPVCRPRFSFLELEGEPVKLWLAKISL